MPGSGYDVTKFVLSSHMFWKTLKKSLSNVTKKGAYTGRYFAIFPFFTWDQCHDLSSSPPAQATTEQASDVVTNDDILLVLAEATYPYT